MSPLEGMPDRSRISRRTGLLGAVSGIATLWGGSLATLSAAQPPAQPTDLRKALFDKVWKTPFIDTHEHFLEEHERLANQFIGNATDDWSAVLTGYLLSDFIVAGMTPEERKAIFSQPMPPREKWKRIAPFWPAVKNTGYGLAVRLTLRELYGVDDLSADTVEKAQAGYERVRRPGFYRHILQEVARVESCQVNSLKEVFSESRMPALIMQDLAIHGMFMPANGGLAERAGIRCATLADWHRVIDWWIDRYGPYAVAVKSANAYGRDVDYAQVPAEQVEDACRRHLASQPVSPQERKALEDHLFWYAVRKATSHRLPVKLHLGYYATENAMPLNRLRNNAGSACELCRAARDTRFVFMHLAYPYYEEMLALAKQYSNAWIDMCWGWIINPIAAKDFLKKFLVTVPANKILTFGGDYCLVEEAVGHALLARHGIATALCELVEEGWLTLNDAMELVDPIMHGNARSLFRLPEKQKALGNVPWKHE